MIISTLDKLKTFSWYTKFDNIKMIQESSIQLENKIIR